MNIKPLTEIGVHRGLCSVTIRIARGQNTTEAQRQASRRRRYNVPIDQCFTRADFEVDGKRMCRAHAGQAALAHLIAASRVPTDEEEAARPRCGCDPAVARRVIIEHGTCAKGGCPYGGDV